VLVGWLVGGCGRQRKLPSSMLCRGNCDEERKPNDGDVNPEGFLADPPPNFDRSQLPVAYQPEANSGVERKLCRQDCEESELVAVADPDRLSAAEQSLDHDRSQLLVADQPEPEVVPSSAGEKPTDTGAMEEAGEYPEKMEFVVHVEQEPLDNPPPSPPAEAHHHHHPESGASSGGSGGGSRRRHHRLPCWDYERRERQCLNGGQCFVIQLHNGIRRSGCR